MFKLAIPKVKLKKVIYVPMLAKKFEMEEALSYETGATKV